MPSVDRGAGEYSPGGLRRQQAADSRPLSASAERLLESVGLLAWPAALEARLLLGAFAAVASLCLGLWWRGTRRASQIVAVFDAVAIGMGLSRCQALQPKM